jgi:hypothetical protein
MHALPDAPLPDDMRLAGRAVTHAGAARSDVPIVAMAESCELLTVVPVVALVSPGESLVVPGDVLAALSNLLRIAAGVLMFLPSVHRWFAAPVRTPRDDQAGIAPSLRNRP